MSEAGARYRQILGAVGYTGELNLDDWHEQRTQLVEWIADAFSGTLEEMQSELVMEQEELTLSVHSSLPRFALTRRNVQLRNRVKSWSRQSNSTQSKCPRSRPSRASHSRLSHAVADTVSPI